ncbi:hypothetical protein C7S17_3717 [Burkholderia thailandensis]|nr:hypothetical protein [Burkholderia thailandensis]
MNGGGRLACRQHDRVDQRHQQRDRGQPMEGHPHGAAVVGAGCQESGGRRHQGRRRQCADE